MTDLPPIDLTHLRSPPVGRKSKRPRSFSQSPTLQNSKRDRQKSPPKTDDPSGLDEDRPDDPVHTHRVHGAEHRAEHDKIPENDPDLSCVQPPLPLPAELGQISNVQAMSPSTGKVVFDFASCHPSRRMSLNF